MFALVTITKLTNTFAVRTSMSAFMLCITLTWTFMFYFTCRNVLWTDRFLLCLFNIVVWSLGLILFPESLFICKGKRTYSWVSADIFTVMTTLTKMQSSFNYFFIFMFYFYYLGFIIMGMIITTTFSLITQDANELTSLSSTLMGFMSIWLCLFAEIATKFAFLWTSVIISTIVNDILIMSEHNTAFLLAWNIILACCSAFMI